MRSTKECKESIRDSISFIKRDMMHLYARGEWEEIARIREEIYESIRP